jgi:hypothetical protein
MTCFYLMLKRICVIVIGLLYMDTANGVAVKLYHSGNTIGEVEINKPARAKQ